VALWTFSADLNHDSHYLNVRQEIGDCVSHGWMHGLWYSSSVRASITGQRGPPKRPYPPFIYGASRVLVGGGRIGGDGSVGAWAAAAVQKYGVLSSEEAGVPPYSGSVAREWGAKGPPQEFLKLAEQYKAEVRLVQTWDEACSAIANGYAVPVCSGQGFQMRAVEANGRFEGRPQGSWPHCMCFIGFDARPGREALYCLNSWGPTAHGDPADYARLDGAPPGGFWVLKPTAERMLAAEDSYAVSFNGFQGQDLWPARKAKSPATKGKKDATSDSRLHHPRGSVGGGRDHAKVLRGGRQLSTNPNAAGRVCRAADLRCTA
jgi:hypothetical protein